MSYANPRKKSPKIDFSHLKHSHFNGISRGVESPWGDIWFLDRFYGLSLALVYKDFCNYS